MWKFGKEHDRAVAPTKPESVPVPTRNVSVPTPKEAYPVETPKPSQSFRSEVAHIGKSVIIKGELSGSEDLYMDGQVEGSIELPSHSITIGPNGRIQANITARDIVVHGKVDGNLRATQRVELRRTASLVGNIATVRIVIEDGAQFKGGIDIQKPEAKTEMPKTSAAVAAAPAPVRPPEGSAQGTLIDKK